MPQDLNDPDELEKNYDDLDIPPSRFSMMTGTLVVIGIATLLIFSGVIWYAYRAGVTEAEQGAVPVIAAEPGDIKVKPSDPGGTNFAHQDKTVYDKIDGNDAGLEQLLPGSEEPKEKPRIITPYNNEMPAEGQPKVVRIPPPADGEKPVAPKGAPDIAAPEIADPMGRTPDAAEPQDNVAAEPAPEVTSGDDAGMPSETAVPETPVAPPSDAPAAQAALQPRPMIGAAPAPNGADGKTFVLQLGAFRSREAADAGWKLLATRHTAALGSLEHYVSEADLGDKGRFFRLQAGPFPVRTDAVERCAALKVAGVDCLVAVR